MSDGSEQGRVWVVAFRGRELLVMRDAHSTTLPDAALWEGLGLAAAAEHEPGCWEGQAFRALELPAETEPPEGTVFRGLRGLFGRLSEPHFRLAGRAAQLVTWDRTHRFCGTCGTATERVPGEMARSCPWCGAQHYPRLSPAVIMRVEDGDRLLLARGPQFAPGVFSTLAGFVEPGESLEEAVVREVREEVGIEVDGVRYFGSQPWPFPHSVMIAFTARYAGGELRLQPGEVEEAGWFTVDELPLVPGPLSIARALIDDWVRTQGGDVGQLRTAAPPGRTA